MVKKKTISFFAPNGEEITVPFLTQKKELKSSNKDKKTNSKKKKIEEDKMCSDPSCQKKEKFYKEYIEALKKRILDYHNLINEYEKDLIDTNKSQFSTKMEEERDELFKML